MRKMSDLVREQNPLMLPASASVMEAARRMDAMPWTGCWPRGKTRLQPRWPRS